MVTFYAEMLNWEIPTAKTDLTEHWGEICQFVIVFYLLSNKGYIIKKYFHDLSRCLLSFQNSKTFPKGKKPNI